MKSRLAIAAVLAALIGCVTVEAWGAEEGEADTTKWSRVEVSNNPGRPRILVIHYPWQVHHRSSVEVRLADPKAKGRMESRPVKFVGEWMKGEATAAVYQARDKAMDLPTSQKLTWKEREYEVTGQLTQLGRPSVRVLIPPKETATDLTAGKALFEDAMPRVVFCLLEAWAFDRQTLWLELPKPEFAGAGKLQVWFLREDNVLWQETVDWPGMAQ